MARKKKKWGSGKGSEEEFSVILGTKTTRKEEPDKEEQQAERKEEKKPVPEEPAPAPQPAEKLSPEDLMKKKQEIERMVASLNDARSTSNMPTYSYSHLKRRYEAELTKINELLVGKGKPVPVTETGPSPGTMAKAGKPKGKAKGTEPEAPESGKMDELIQRVGRIESVHGMIPSFNSQLASLKSKMNEYQQVVDRLKSDEQELAEELPRVKRSLSAMKARARKDRAMKPLPAREPLAADVSGLEKMSKKVDTLASKLMETLGALKNRIDQVSVVDELETKGYVKELRKDIRKVRSELAHFLKKDDLKKLVLQPVEERGREPLPAPKDVKPKAKKRDIVGIDELDGHMGKDITIECSLSLLKSVRQKGIRMYWYRIEDGTGESILTSSSEINVRKAVLKGSVKKTKTGTVYVLFKKLSP